MKAIVLAAGQGMRLRPLTNDRPKCMVEYSGALIIDHIFKAMQNCGVWNIAIVGGYKIEILKKHLSSAQVVFFENKNYEVTNMVSTLFCAEEFMDDDLIVSYSDIAYSDKVLATLKVSDSDISVVVDRRWRELWSKRFQNPLDDAESMRIENKQIVELGKKVRNIDEIQGQYIGLIKFSKNILPVVIEHYKKIDKRVILDGKDFNNMYMTSFIQSLINAGLSVTPVLIDGGWIEIDSIDDLQISAI